MKKTIAMLLLLIILAGTGFGFGYVPIRLDPGTRAVLFSKTSGWHDSTFEAGTFAWAWELLIPTNATLYVFQDEPRSLQVVTDSLLPSADLYSRYLEGEPRFEERIDLRISYRVSPEALSELAPAGLRPDGMDDWYSETDKRIEGLTLRMLGEIIEDTAIGSEVLAVSEVASAVEDRLQERLPHVKLLSAVINELALSDIELYREGRDTYMAVQNARRESLTAAARELAQAQATNDQRFGNLERYGELLTEYPILLDYLEIAATRNADPLDLTDLSAFEDATP